MIFGEPSLGLLLLGLIISSYSPLFKN